MNVVDIDKEIDKLEAIKKILLSPAENNIDFIFKSYIETEALAKSKKLIDRMNIRQENGNKYQFNDIRRLIKSNHPAVSEETRELAQMILKKNKIRR